MKSKKYRVDWTLWAATDLESILDYISERSVNGALTVYNTIHESAQKLVQQPELGRVVPELRKQDINMYREIIADHWRILYRFDETTVIVHAVIDSRRDIEHSLLTRMINRQFIP